MQCFELLNTINLTPSQSLDIKKLEMPDGNVTLRFRITEGRTTIMQCTLMQCVKGIIKQNIDNQTSRKVYNSSSYVHISGS